MAIRDDSAKGSQEETLRGAQPKQEQVYASTGGQLSRMRMIGAPVPSGIGIQYVTDLVTKLAEIYKKSAEEYEVALITLNNLEDTDLRYSCLVVATKFKEDRSNNVACHTLLLEATISKDILPVFQTINNEQVRVLRVPGDAYDERLILKVRDKVSRAFPGKNILVAGCTVVPKMFDITNLQLLDRLAANTAWACGTEITTRRENFTDINLTTMTKENLVIDVSFTKETILDCASNPIRSDVSITKSVRNIQPNQNQYVSLNSPDTEQIIDTMNGFVDVLWNPAAPQNQMGVYAMQSMPGAYIPPQKYVSRFVITNIASGVQLTTGGVLLNLLNFMALSQNNNWFQAFRPVTNMAGIDTYDVGALNIEANLGGKPNEFGDVIDTKASNFGIPELGTLISNLIDTKGILISMDCPEAAPETWYTDVIRAAASGNAGAAMAIIHAANDLTGGHFRKHFPEGSPLFVGNGERVHMGYWIDRNGQKRDLRDVDYIFMANMVGRKDPMLIKDWSDTFTRTEYPLELRLASRENMIVKATSESAVFTGFASRVTFSEKFLMALAMSFNDTGWTINVNTPLSAGAFQTQRGVATFAGQGLMPASQGFIRPAGMGAPTQAYGGTYTGRQWG